MAPSLGRAPGRFAVLHDLPRTTILAAAVVAWKHHGGYPGKGSSKAWAV